MKSRRTPAVSPLPVWAGGLGALALCFLVLPLAFMLGRVNWATLGATLATDEASAALALARCLGEFGATLTFAGSMQGVTRTMPLQIYLARESDADLALALGVVLLGVAALVVALTETPWERAVSFLRARLSSTRPGRGSASEAASGARAGGRRRWTGRSCG